MFWEYLCLLKTTEFSFVSLWELGNLVEMAIIRSQQYENGAEGPY